MRYQGRIVRWNEARGFGFITPEQKGGEQQGRELFVHISALQSDGRLPEVGERVSYQIGAGQDGKPRAEQVFFPDRPLSLADTSVPPCPAKTRFADRRPGGHRNPFRPDRAQVSPIAARAAGAAS